MIALWGLVVLLDAAGEPLTGEVHVDGRVCTASACALEPGRHTLTYDGQTHRFQLSPDQESVRAVVSSDPTRFGVFMRRSMPAPEPSALPSALPGQIQTLGYTLDAQLPAQLRVARHADNNCSNPILRIDEVPLQSYVAGVVHGEIGIFRAAGTGQGVAIERGAVDDRVRASFETFAIAARTYAVWWYLRKGADAEFHIHDGPCNQVYQDARDPLSEAAAESTSGQILVPSFDRTEIEKHEYASSCARQGTLPSYRNPHDVRREDIVADSELDPVCVRTWCGHDSYRMAHQDNPFLEAGNRCLVRGICQWGSLERSVRGDSTAEILNHYQPDLMITRPGAVEPVGSLEGAVGDSQGDSVGGARIKLSRGQQQEIEFADAQGAFRFVDLEAGLWTLDAAAQGYQAQSIEVRIVAGQTSYQDLVLSRAAPGRDAGSVDAAGVDSGATADASWVADGGPAQRSDRGQDIEPGQGCGCLTASAEGWLLLVLFVGRRRRRGVRRAMGALEAR